VGACYKLGVATHNSNSHGGAEIFEFAQWINGFFSMSLATNVTGTGMCKNLMWTFNLTKTTLISQGLLAFRIWRINQTTSEFRETGFMLPVFRVVVDTGLMYTVTLLVTLVVFEAKSNAQTICLDIVSDSTLNFPPCT
jgi:hypothetical protein